MSQAPRDENIRATAAISATLVMLVLNNKGNLHSDMRFGSSERRCGGEARNTNADQRRKEPCEDGDAEERQTVVGEN